MARQRQPFHAVIALVEAQLQELRANATRSWSQIYGAWLTTKESVSHTGNGAAELEGRLKPI